MEQKEKLMELIKEQIKIEEAHVSRITEMEKKVHNAAAKLFLLEMRLDSQKHAGILTGILKTLKEVSPSQTLWEHKLAGHVDPIVVRRELETHVKMETDVLAHVEEEMKHTKDEGLRLLLQHIADDEAKHHKILQAILKNVYKIT